MTGDPSIEQRVRLIEETTARIWPLMKGHGPEVQSAIIADMLATFLAGHAPPLRDATLEKITALAKALVPVNEAILFAGQGHPYTRHKEDSHN